MPYIWRMDDPSQLTAFGQVLILAIVGVVLVVMTLFLGRLVAPSHPNSLKLSTYECGELPIGSSRIPFNNRFYIIALIFLLFEVEMLFIFPWATVFGQSQLLAIDARWGWLSFAEMGIFIGVLLLGLIVVWKKGDLQWVAGQPVPPKVNATLPKEAYLHLMGAQPHRSSNEHTVQNLVNHFDQ